MKVALAQLAPVFLDRPRTLEKALGALEEAAHSGAELVAFGETFLPGYPGWLERTDGARFESDVQKDIHARYVSQAVTVEGPEVARLAATAARLHLFVVIGVLERDPTRGRSVFATALSIGPDGRVRSAHRKLMPTYEERLTWTPGDAAGLEVHDHGPFRVGTLNCWENWMPLPRAALYARGETLHVALWPGHVRNTEPITRFLAREGRTYAISVGSVLRGRDIPSDFPHRELWVTDEDEILFDGGSCIAGPDGGWLLPPEGQGREGLLYAELDPVQIDRERQNFDPAGHYSRPELLELHVRTARPRSRYDT